MQCRLTEDPDRSCDPPTLDVEFMLNGGPVNAVNFMHWLDTYGHTPLPPYIAQESSRAAIDRDRYQTTYAEGQGSVAAPTAGLHYTPQLLQELKTKKNIEVLPITLHVGAGTFLPVKQEDPQLHTMHEERFYIASTTVKKILMHKHQSKPIIAVGTTTLRALESLWLVCDRDENKIFDWCDRWLRTSIFIRPEFADSRHTPWCINALQTNFHQPKSTLIMLVASLIGWENTMKMYREAADQRYRFFSYGDSTLLWL